MTTKKIKIGAGINKRRASEQEQRNAPLQENGKLCLCVAHIKELIKSEFDERILDFPTRVLEDEEDRIKNNIPKSIFSITELTQFYYTKSDIVKVSSKIQMLQNLKVLNLSRNDLAKLPDSLSKITVLEDVNLSHNLLTECPVLPTSVVTVDLCSNRILGVSTQFQNCDRLDRLILHSNQICSTDPEAFSGCSNLHQIDMSHNKLDVFPECLAQVSSLEWLDLSFNSIGNFPSAMIENEQVVANLRGLYLAQTDIKPAYLVNIAKLERLENLNLNDNFLQELPEEFANLKWLQAIWLKNNRFVEFPQALNGPKFLGCIDLNDNEIKFIDEDVTQLENLCRGCVSLELSGNGLLAFPEQFCKFRRLVRLNLSLNSCQKISNEMAEYFKKQFPTLIKQDCRTKSYDDGLLLYGNPFGPQMVKTVKAGDLEGLVVATKQDQQRFDGPGIGPDGQPLRMKVIE